MASRVSQKRPRLTREWLQESALACIAEGYHEHLRAQGYAVCTTAQYLGALAHFAHWVSCTGKRVPDIDETLVARFFNQHVPICRCPRVCVRDHACLHFALSVLLRWLHSQKRIVRPVPPAGSIQAQLQEFERYLSEVRGLVASTRAIYAGHVRRLLRHRFGDRRIRIGDLTAHDVRDFMRQHTDWKPLSLRQVRVALRSYFRFATLNGQPVGALMAALPRTACWRLAGLPKALTSEEVERLLAAFDRSHPTGLRDHAIARCLADLGLRAVEVSRLCLDDVDWRQGTLAIRGKGRRVELLPLPRPLGVALARYLRRVRPRSRSRVLFLPRRAPRDQPLKSSAIGEVLRQAACRCGLQDRFTGTHCLRHTIATRLVQRGASLTTVAHLLRHRSFDTTAIYAKVDLATLARVALPWPGRRT